MLIQHAVVLSPKIEECHQIIDEVVNQLVNMKQIKTGLRQLFIQSNSAREYGL
jgi:uncharacterized membrane protein YjjP (DUF1212 family)